MANFHWNGKWKQFWGMYAHTQYYLRSTILVSLTAYKKSLVAGMIVTQYAPCQILSQALQGHFWSCLWLTTTSPPTKQKRSVTNLHTMYTQWDGIFVDELTSLIFSKKGTPNTLWAAWRLERMRKSGKGKGWNKADKGRESGEEERRSSRRICLFYTDIHITHLLEMCYWDQGFILIQYQLLIPYFLPQERRTESSYTEPRAHKNGRLE